MQKCVSYLLTLLLPFASISQLKYGSEPKWEGKAVHVDSLGNRNQCETQSCYYVQKTGASVYVAGIGKVKGENCVDGSTSFCQINKRDTIFFLARHSSNQIDPDRVFRIFKLEQREAVRCVLTASAGVYSGSSVSNIAQQSFVAEKYGDSSYLLKLINVEPGEYALTFEGSRDYFNLFTVTEEEYYIDTLSGHSISIDDTVYFKVQGDYVQGAVDSIEKKGVRARYVNSYGVLQRKYVNFEYLLYSDPRSE